MRNSTTHNIATQHPPPMLLSSRITDFIRTKCKVLGPVVFVRAGRTVRIAHAKELEVAQDIGTMTARVHPALHDPGNIDLTSSDVFSQSIPIELLSVDARRHGRAVGARVAHEILGRLVLGMQLGCLLQLRVGTQRRLALLRSLSVDSS